MAEKKKYTSSKRTQVFSKPKPRKKQFNKNGIQILGQRPAKARIINGEVFY